MIALLEVSQDTNLLEKGKRTFQREEKFCILMGF